MHTCLCKLCHVKFKQLKLVKLLSLSWRLQRSAWHQCLHQPMSGGLHLSTTCANCMCWMCDAQYRINRAACVSTVWVWDRFEPLANIRNHSVGKWRRIMALVKWLALLLTTRCTLTMFSFTSSCCTCGERVWIFLIMLNIWTTYRRKWRLQDVDKMGKLISIKTEIWNISSKMFPHMPENQTDRFLL